MKEKAVKGGARRTEGGLGVEGKEGLNLSRELPTTCHDGGDDKS